MSEPESPVKIVIYCICGAEKTEKLESLTPEFMKEAYCAACGRMTGELWQAALVDLGIVKQDDSSKKNAPEVDTEPENAAPAMPDGQNAPPEGEIKRRENVFNGAWDRVKELMASSPPCPQSYMMAAFWFDPGVPPRIGISYQDAGDVTTNGVARLERTTMLLTTLLAGALRATPDAFSRNAVRQHIAQILAPVLMPENPAAVNDMKGGGGLLDLGRWGKGKKK